MTSQELKKFDQVAQLSHFGWGLAIIAIPHIIFENLLLDFGILILWTIYTYFKEFWWDYKYETPEIRGSSKKDFIVQVSGAVTSILIILIKAYENLL